MDVFHGYLFKLGVVDWYVRNRRTAEFVVEFPVLMVIRGLYILALMASCHASAGLFDIAGF